MRTAKNSDFKRSGTRKIVNIMMTGEKSENSVTTILLTLLKFIFFYILKHILGSIMAEYGHLITSLTSMLYYLFDNNAAFSGNHP